MELDPTYSLLLTRLRAELQPLPDMPDETPEAALTCLWALASGCRISVGQAAEFTPNQLDDPQLGHLHELIEQRLLRTPLAHLTGRQDFMGLVMLASADALIPRKETEILGNAAVSTLEGIESIQPLVIDVCTGAGNVALGMAAKVPRARILGADLSREAIELAKRNASFLNLERVEFRCGDLLEPFRDQQILGSVDVLTCNPPYISSSRVETMPEEISRHEPRLAFDGGPFGIGLIRRLVREAPDFLKPGGWLLFEVGLGQGPGIARSLERDSNFDSIATYEDADGQVRVVAAHRAASRGEPTL